jgi:hypothetical protein
VRDERFYPVRLWPKDLGVALVVLIALGLGLVLRLQVEGAMREFRDPGSPFRISYPASWTGAEPADALLRVEDPRTDSAFKTTLTVESRLLDPAAPPTLQTLVDQRVAEQGALTAYRLLTTGDATIDGARGARIEYGYVVQPIDAPRRASLPVVVQAREYVVGAQDRVYYITLAAPQHEYEEAQARFEQSIAKVKVQ